MLPLYNFDTILKMQAVMLTHHSDDMCIKLGKSNGG